jgi:hydroxymethylbilane synthase
MAPIGALGRMEQDELHLSAVVLSADGVRRLTASEAGSLSEAELLGARVAYDLLAQGAAELIAASRNG